MTAAGEKEMVNRYIIFGTYPRVACSRLNVYEWICICIFLIATALGSSSEVTGVVFTSWSKVILLMGVVERRCCLYDV